MFDAEWCDLESEGSKYTEAGFHLPSPGVGAGESAVVGVFVMTWRFQAFVLNSAVGVVKSAGEEQFTRSGIENDPHGMGLKCGNNTKIHFRRIALWKSRWD